MSGGIFNYANEHLKSELYGWNNERKNVFEDREISELIYDVLNLIEAFDYYKCGDTGEKEYLAAKTAFKDKWLKKSSTKTNARYKQYIEDALAECKAELYKTFGIDDENK